jgi:hypothetical protein
MIPSPPRATGATVLLVTVALMISGPTLLRAKPPRPPRDAAADARAEFDLQSLIHWLLSDEHDHQMVRLPFAAVVLASTGHQILPFHKDDPIDAGVLSKLSRGMEEVLRRMNAEDSPARGVKRVNEASHFFEDAMREIFHGLPGLRCEFAPNSRGQVQRSGYPDLRVTDTASGRTYYVDPKLYEEHSRRSSFRTFYFEPRRETNKVLADACHIVVGIAHNGVHGEGVRFLNWEFVDCSGLVVQLKAEFHAGNHDLYREDAVLATGKAVDSPPPPTTAPSPGSD